MFKEKLQVEILSPSNVLSPYHSSRLPSYLSDPPFQNNFFSPTQNKSLQNFYQYQKNISKPLLIKREEGGGGRREEGGGRREEGVTGLRREEAGRRDEGLWRREEGGGGRREEGLWRREEGLRKEEGGGKKEEGGRRDDGGRREEGGGMRREASVEVRRSLEIGKGKMVRASSSSKLKGDSVHEIDDHLLRKAPFKNVSLTKENKGNWEEKYQIDLEKYRPMTGKAQTPSDQPKKSYINDKKVVFEYKSIFLREEERREREGVLADKGNKIEGIFRKNNGNEVKKASGEYKSPINFNALSEINEVYSARHGQGVARGEKKQYFTNKKEEGEAKENSNKEAINMKIESNFEELKKRIHARNNEVPKRTESIDAVKGGDGKNQLLYHDDFKECQKLQEKLNSLEKKILSMKNAFDSNKRCEKPFLRKSIQLEENAKNTSEHQIHAIEVSPSAKPNKFSLTNEKPERRIYEDLKIMEKKPMNQKPENERVSLDKPVDKTLAEKAAMEKFDRFKSIRFEQSTNMDPYQFRANVREDSRSPKEPQNEKYVFKSLDDFGMKKYEKYEKLNLNQNSNNKWAAPDDPRRNERGPETSSKVENKPENKLIERLERPRTMQTTTTTPKTNDISALKNYVTQVHQHSILPDDVSAELIEKKVNVKTMNMETKTSPKNELNQYSIKKMENTNFRYYVSSVVRAFSGNEESMACWKEHFSQTMQAVLFSKFLKANNEDVVKKQIFLARKDRNKKTIIFDLDETLIHCNENSTMDSDVILPIQFPNGLTVEAGINVRPFTHDCLRELSKHYELIVFTASHSCYANVVLNYLDPNKEFIQHRLSRENCILSKEGLFIKDLRVLKNRDLKDVLIVDNAAYSFGFQLENGIPILPFYKDKSDIELKNLTHYLVGLKDKDLRGSNGEFFKLNRYEEFTEPGILVKELYRG